MLQCDFRLGARELYKSLNSARHPDLLLLFPFMSSKKPSASAPEIDEDYQVLPVASKYWSALNHSSAKNLVRGIFKAATGQAIPAALADSAMSHGIRAIVRIPSLIVVPSY